MGDKVLFEVDFPTSDTRDEEKFKPLAFSSNEGKSTASPDYQ